MSVKVTKDNTAKILKAISDLAKKDVLVGIPEAAGEREGGITNAQLGYLQENGSPTNKIPPRPFLIPGVQGAQALIAETLGSGAMSALSGDAAAGEKSLQAAGLLGRNAVVRKINTGPFAPNAPRTIAAKGSDKPLIDTGELRKSITYVVRNK